jgi:hypothetical protein
MFIHSASGNSLLYFAEMGHAVQVFNKVQAAGKYIISKLDSSNTARFFFSQEFITKNVPVCHSLQFAAIGVY